MSSEVFENPKTSTCEDDEESGEIGRDSCTRLSTNFRQYCVEPNEEDNVSWCDAHGITYRSSPCPLEDAKICEIPIGGDYTSVASAYFYGVTDAALEEECDELNGIVQ